MSPSFEFRGWVTRSVNELASIRVEAGNEEMTSYENID